ncbi:SET domain-containing protein [Armillaria solidipes]|uniref:SET domain-containing protein n=1 Tax=Armillaria solidipes TaxID=1076256 RepID=A0A2H3BZW5_9AGAR|nr:SET domain-containing protein [Armillaria solidipes]
MKRGFLTNEKAKRFLSAPTSLPVKTLDDAEKARVTLSKANDTTKVLQSSSKAVPDKKKSSPLESDDPWRDIEIRFPGGGTQCLVTDDLLQRLVRTPGGCPQPIKDSDLGGNYRISPTPGKGLGMFATRDFNTGDLIVNERPLMVVPRIPVGVLTDEGVLDEKATKTILHQAEKVMCPIFKRMREEDKKAFMELHNSHLQDGSGPILGVIRTNGYVFGDEAETNSNASTKENHTSIFKDLSRVNHSCSPNTSHKFHVSTFSMQLRAARDIKVGEEIFTTYTDILEPAAVRAKDLTSYQITCACRACLDPDRSDPIRAAVLKRPAIFVPMQKDFGEDWIDPALETLSRIEQEEL